MSFMPACFRSLIAIAVVIPAFALEFLTISEGSSVAMTQTQGIGAGPTYFTLTEDPTLPGEVILNAGGEFFSTPSWSIQTNPAHGSAWVEGQSNFFGANRKGVVRYLPDPDHNGSDSFEVKVTAGALEAIATVNVTIVAANDAPVIVDGALTAAGTSWTTTTTPIFQGPAWYGLASSADGTTLVGAVGERYVYVSRNSGVTWAARIGDKARAWRDVACSDDGQYQFAVCSSSADLWWSSTYGRTWAQWPVTVSGTQIAAQDWTGIDCTADGRYVTMCATGGFIYTWDRLDLLAGFTQRGTAKTWKGIAMSSTGLYQAAAESGTGGKIWLSTDSGATWNTTMSPTGTTFLNWEKVAIDDNGTIWAPLSQDYVYQGTAFGTIWTDKPWGLGYGAGKGFHTQVSVNPSGSTILVGGLYYEDVVFSGDSGTSFTRPSPSRQSQALALSNAGDKFVITPTGGSPQWSQGARRVTMSEDGNPTPFALTLTASDAESETLTWSISTAASNGTAAVSGTGTSKAISYTPTTDWNGTDTFTVTVTDASGATDSLDVQVVVEAVNDAPVATAQTVAATEDTSIAITLAGSDIDGTIASYAVVTSPTKGILSGTAPNLTFTPTANLNGSDSFTFTVTDNNGVISAPATVTLNIASVNDLPVATAQSVSTLRNVALSITLAATDVDGTVTSYAYNQPSHGTVTGTGPNVTYTPTSGYVGPDSFQFYATDNLGGEGFPATVTVTVTPNAVPIATSQSVTTIEDTATSITLAGTDADGSVVAYAVTSVPAKGVLSGTAPLLTYTPSADATGGDMFTFTVTDDGGATSAAGTVSLAITPVNDAPTATALSVTTNEDTAVAVSLAGTDVDGTIASYTVVTNPTQGALSGTAPALTYTPTANANGSDSFTYSVTDDGGLTSAVVTVALTVSPVNDLPTATPQSVSVLRNTNLSITLAGTDVDGTVTGYTYTQPAHGTVTGTGAALTYTPVTDYVGTDSFTFIALDQLGGESAPATVSLTVIPNAAPTATAQSVTTAEDTAVAITLTGADVDGSITSFSLVTSPTLGTLTGTIPNLTFTPTAQISGSDSFTFTVTDNIGTVSAPATVSITITPVNDLPTATALTATTDEDVSVGITLVGTDSDGSIASYAVVSGPTHGTLTGTAPALTYVPSAHANGSDAFTYTVTDDLGGVSAAATVSIAVASINDAPVITEGTALAVNLSPTSTVNSAQVTLHATDADGDVLTWTAGTASHGTVAVTSPGGATVVTYTPNRTFVGNESVSVTVSDGHGGSDTLTVTVTVDARGLVIGNSTSSGDAIGVSDGSGKSGLGCGAGGGLGLVLALALLGGRRRSTGSRQAGVGLLLALALVGGSATAEELPFHLRLGYVNLPTYQSTDLSVTDVNGKVTTIHNQTGRLEGHWRFEPRVVHDLGGLGEGWSLALAWGPDFSHVRAVNDLGGITHESYGLGVEPTVVLLPEQPLRLEFGLSLHAAYTSGEMLVSQQGGAPSRQESRYGLTYDSTVVIRPVVQVTPTMEAFVQIGVTPFMEERLNYRFDGVTVVEVNRITGGSFGLGLGATF